MREQLIKCCGYVRVSTEEQVQGFSLEAQKDEIKRFAKENGYELVHIYEEKGESAKDLNRTQFQKMLRDSFNDKFDVILAWRIDRISREVTDILNLKKDLSSRDKRLIITTTGMDSSRETDDFSFLVYGFLSEEERKRLLARTKLGMKKRAQDGLFNGGVVYGYNSVNKRLIVDEEESKIVEEIFELRALGKGYKYIALQLNARGIKTKREKAFSIGGVRGILHNPIYIGLIKYGEYVDWNEKRRKGKSVPEIVKGQHKSIISQELWNNVQEINKKYREKRLVNRKVKGELLLTGVIRCPICGYGTVMHKSKGHVYYMCGQYHNKGISECKSNLIRRDNIEKSIENIVLHLIKNEEIVKDMIDYYEKINDANTDTLNTQLEATTKNMAVIQKKLDKLQEEYLSDLLNDFATERNHKAAEMLNNHFKELELKERKLTGAIEEKNHRQINEQGIREVFEVFEKVYYSADRLTKKALLRSLIKRIEVSKDRKRIETVEFWFFPDYSLPLGELGGTVP